MKKFKALPFITLLGFLLGSNLVFSRFTFDQFTSTEQSALRFVIASLVYLLIFWLSPDKKFPKNRSLWIRAGIWGIIGSAIPMSLLIGALNYQSSGISSLLMTLIPVITMIMAHVILHDEKITFQKITGIFFAFAGVGLILIRGESGLAELSHADWRGYALTGAGVLIASSSVVYARYFLKDEDRFQAAAIRMFVAAAVLMPYVLITEGLDFSHVNASGIAVLLYLGIIGTFLSFLLELTIIQRFGATYATHHNFMMPIVATGLGALILHEQITPTILIGMGIVLTGLWFLNQPDKSNAVLKETQTTP